MITAFTQGLSVYPQESVEKIISHKIYSYIIMYSPKIYDYFLRVPIYSKYCIFSMTFIGLLTREANAFPSLFFPTPHP